MLKTFLVLFLILAGGVSQTALAKIEISLDKTSGFIGESFLLEVRVHVSHENPPVLPEIPSTTIRRGGRQSVIQIINNRQTSLNIYTFQIVPLVEGRFDVGPVLLEANGQQFESEVLSFEARQRSQEGEAPEVFVERSFSTTAPYVEQTILMRVKLYSRVATGQAQVQPQIPDGFTAYPIEEQRRSQVLLHGYRYNVLEIGWVLVPQVVGTFAFEPFTFLVVVEDTRQQRRRNRMDSFGFPDFFGRGGYRQQSFFSSPETVEVRAIPQDPGRQRWSGLVGDFSLTARLDQKIAEVGDSLDLELVISGFGSLEKHTEFSSEFANDAFKLYPDRGQHNKILGLEEGFYSEFSQSYAIVPTQPGSYDLGSYSITVFSPIEGKFLDLVVALGSIEVSGEPYELEATGVAEQEFNGDQDTIESLVHFRGKKLYQLRRIAAFDVYFTGFSIGGGLFGLFYSLFITGFFSRRQRQPWQEKTMVVRRRLLTILESDDAAQDTTELVIEAARLLRNFLVLQLTRQESYLTSKEILTLISRFDLHSDLYESCRELFLVEESISFAGKQPDCDAVAKLIKTLAEQIRNFEPIN